MLTQQQVDKIVKCLLQTQKQLAINAKEVYIAIAKEVGCGVTTVANIHTGRRDLVGRLADSLMYTLPKSKFDCPRCGLVVGTSCVRCDAAQIEKQDECEEGPGPVANDPSPELIALRAGIIRMRRECKRKRINYKDPAISLWVAREEEVLRT